VNLSKRPGGFDDSPAWSPDGKKIAWAATENGQSDIYVMNADGSGQVNLTNTPKAYDISPRWSPDGSMIAFVSNRDGNLEIYVMNADGSGQVNLTNNPAEDTNPLWRP
jgi:TolB protein